MPGRRQAAAVAALLAVALLTTACGERSEPTGPAADLFPITVTAADDREVTLREPARRVSVLDPTLTPLVEALGIVESETPVSPDGEVRIGELRRFRPDVVIASPLVSDRELSRAAAAVDAPLYAAPVSSLREVERAITQLGMLVAEPSAARRMVADIEKRRRSVVATVRGRPRVSTFIDFGSFTTATDRTLTGDLLRIAGGLNVAGRASDGGPFDLEELRRADPDVYLTTSDSHVTLEALRQDKKTRRLRAVREGRVVVIDAGDLEPGPRIGRALQQLARALHPDAPR